MAKDLAELEKTMQALTHGLAPAQRKNAASKAAKTLRKANARREGQNVDPDGNPFAPRLRDKHGKVRTKAKMFRKLRQARHLKDKATADGFEVGFSSSADGRIASVHHYGLRDKVTKTSRTEVKYAARRLLGFSQADEEAIMDAVPKLVKL